MPINLIIDNESDFLIRLTGIIDEHSEWPTTVPKPRQRIVIDCLQIERVNSIGLQNWGNWMRSRGDGQQFVFIGCQPRIMETFFTIDGFLPHQFTIESFQLTYECLNCDHAEVLLLERGKHYIEAVGNKPFRMNIPSHVNCPKCRGQMQPDGIENRRLKTLEKMF